MLTAALAVLCALLVLVLLVQRPAIWPVLVVLAVLWFALFGVFRYRVRSWVARWVCGGSFEKSKTQFSLEPLSQPAALLSGETVLWYNTEFRTRLMKGEALLVPRVQKVLPGLDLQEARKVSGQLLNLADGVWNAHSSTVPGEAESMTLLVLNEETALRKVEAEYKASRPGYLVFLVDGYDDVFSDMLDSERARLLEGINRVLEDMIGRGTGFLRRVASGRYIAVVEERQLEQFAKRGYDVLDKIRALDPSVNLSISIGVGRGAKTLREAQDMAVQALDMAQGRGGDQAAGIGVQTLEPSGFTDLGIFPPFGRRMPFAVESFRYVSVQEVRRGQIVVVHRTCRDLLRCAGQRDQQAFLLRIQHGFQFVVAMLSGIIGQPSIQHDISQILTTEHRVSGCQVRPYALLDGRNPHQRPVSPR